MEAAALVAEPNDERTLRLRADPTQRFSKDAVLSFLGRARWEDM